MDGEEISTVMASKQGGLIDDLEELLGLAGAIGSQLFGNRPGAKLGEDKISPANKVMIARELVAATKDRLLEIRDGLSTL